MPQFKVNIHRGQIQSQTEWGATIQINKTENIPWNICTTIRQAAISRSYQYLFSGWILSSSPTKSLILNNQIKQCHLSLHFHHKNVQNYYHACNNDTVWHVDAVNSQIWVHSLPFSTLYLDNKIGYCFPQRSIQHDNYKNCNFIFLLICFS